MKVEHQISLIDDILAEWSADLGGSLAGYRNHVYRMVNFTLAFGDLDQDQRQKVIIAGCFHDIGIWPGNNFDYLPPSITRAKKYLERNGLRNWSEEIATMIGEHHKLRKYPNAAIVEAFRKGDLADFSLGLVKSGLPSSYVRDVKAAFPNEGFHKNLVKIAAGWVCRHPLNPVPVLRW